MDIIKQHLIEKAYKKYPDLVRFPEDVEFTEDNGILVFWYNVPLKDGKQTTKVETYGQCKSLQ